MDTLDAQQEAMMKVEPQSEHNWLQKFVGDWTLQMECANPNGDTSHKNEGKETVRTLGGLWVVAEGRGQLPDGSPALSILTLGYDPKRRKFTGTWIGSMMTHLWVYEGELDAAGKALTLYTEGPVFDGTDKVGKYKEVIEFKDDDYRVWTSHLQGQDGQWQQFMKAECRRSK